MKNNGTIISAAALADLCGYSTTRLAQLVNEGILRRDAANQLPRDDSIRALFTWLRSRIGETTSTLGSEKLRLLQLESKLKEIAVKRLEGELIPANEVEAAWANIILLVRQRLLRVANKTAPRLVFAKTEQEIEKEIHSEIEEALRELSRKPGSQTHTPSVPESHTRQA